MIDFIDFLSDFLIIEHLCFGDRERNEFNEKKGTPFLHKTVKIGGANAIKIPESQLQGFSTIQPKRFKTLRLVPYLDNQTQWLIVGTKLPKSFDVEFKDLTTFRSFAAQCFDLSILICANSGSENITPLTNLGSLGLDILKPEDIAKNEFLMDEIRESFDTLSKL